MNKRGLICIILILVSVGFVFATDYYISPTGNNSNDCSITSPCAALQYINDNKVRAGDTIYVRGGVYYQSRVNWNKSGELGNQIIIKAYPGEYPVFDGNNTAIFWMYLNPKYKVHHLTIEGIEFKNYVGTNTASIMMMIHVHDIIIKNNYFHDNGKGINNSIKGGSVLNIYDNTNFTVCNSYGNLIENNLFINNGHDSDCSTSFPHNIYLSGGVRDSIIRNNFFIENKYCQTAIVKIGKGGVTEIPENENISIYNNIFYQSTSKITASGLFISSKNVSIFNNTFYTDCNYSLNSCMALRDWQDSNIRNNLFYSISPTSTILTGVSWGRENIDFNLWYPERDSDDTGNNSFIADPLFINSSNPLGQDGILWTSDDGFRLQEGSPACGNGTNGGDIGAYPCTSNKTIQNSTDINLDGKTDINDVRICMNVIIGTETNPLADVNGDESVDLNDVKEIVNDIS